MKAERDRSIRYAFGDISVDAAHLMVYRGDHELDLPPKAVQTLIALVERRGQIVSKDELMSAIWTDSVVEESNLSRYIYLLRSQLGGKPGGGEYIQTLRRRGYRFSSQIEVCEYDAGKAKLPDVHPAYPEDDAMPERLEGTHNKVVRFEDWTHAHEGASVPEGSAGRSYGRSGPKLKSLPKRTGTRKTAVVSTAALLVAALFAAFYFLWPRSPILTGQETIIVASFDNRTGDPIFDGTLRQGLVMQLQQSPFLTILPDEEVRETLRLMKRPTDSPIDRSAARELCVRKGFRVFVTGSIVRLGKAYVIGLEAVSAATDRAVAIEQVQAETKEGVLEALSSAARNLRERLGEELESIEKLEVPLEVTTGSIEALRMHTLGWKELRRGRAAGAIPYFVRAIETDPDFASAYGDLAVAYDNAGFRSEAVATAKDAYARIGNVSEIEKLNISDLYHSLVTYQMEEREKILEVYKNLYPRDFRPRLRLASVHVFQGNYEQAIEEARESVRLGSHRSYSDWGRSLIALGAYREARDVLQQAERSGFDSQAFHFQLAEIGILTDDPGLTERELTLLDQPQFRPSGLLIRARKSLQGGKFAEGIDLYREAITFVAAEGDEPRVARLRTEAALHASLFGKCAVAMEFLRGRTDFLLVEGVQALAAEAFARCGQNSEALKLLNELLALYPKGTIPNKLTSKIVRALIAENRGDSLRSVALLGEVPGGLEDKSGFRVTYLKGNALLRLRKSSEAGSEFRRIIDNRGKDPISPIYWLSVLGMARSLAAAGDRQGARASYEKFFSVWREADGDLPDLIAARKEYGALN